MIVIETVLTGLPSALPGTVTALLGAVAGLIAGQLVLQLGMLTGGLLTGASISRVIIGVGPRLRAWTSARRTVVLRAIPLFLSVSVAGGREPVRLRMWGTGAWAALLGLVGVVASWLWLSGDSPGRGAAVGVTATVLASLVPRRDSSGTSIGWLVLSLPRLGAAEVAEMSASVLAGRVTEALNAGRLPEARAALAEMGDRHGDSWATAACRIAVWEAEGNYVEAVTLAMRLSADESVELRRRTATLAGLAGLVVSAVEADQLPAAAALPAGGHALEQAERLGFPAYKLHGTKAAFALLDGRTEEAIRLALLADDFSHGPLARADNFATLARARMAAGDNRSARQALAQAEEHAAWWPRVVALRARLDIA
ncbi:hypothetical protein AHOG_06085 [Actinoalloteichus hoggarensis]|uniref:Tetratricopeptide repeat protein n=1 Tax=Actinoalloteichus hoggarensis TaxID=1470176 RepID=A0A221VZB9_9PSEU|nr:hypothetical protein AHOG_06085 [Actinoalloteichus hoggarensis]